MVVASYASASLDRHNLYRPRHRAQPLRWSDSLTADAQAWANRCVFEHASGTGQGENLAWGYNDPVSAIDAYYAESSQYTYGQPSPSNFEAVGHFTQMVWLASTDLGCAVASCNGGQLFHVCRYYPAGNVWGQFADNVLPPST
ncbi:Protein PRY2 [Tetrabaena socialis]|uniref:Protein PRY2 n=1 Tax=Tetrabaena socialis TaxID=47790 RepID=A0A2J8AG80_9CHLO|nr:Protein PRY2 [Tetrabaena socialis]|eukprot:PNH11533.1 Protein PRY2 [Tetrabaena socialis]